MNTTTVQVRLPNIYHFLNTARSEYRTSIRTLDIVLVKNRMQKILIAVRSGQFENRTDDNFGFGIQNIPYSDARYKILSLFISYLNLIEISDSECDFSSSLHHKFAVFDCLIQNL